jgi:hypothetical protein
MNITPLTDLIYETTNLSEDSTPNWSATAGYAVDTIRQLNKKLYQSLGVIDALCEYVHDDSDPLRTHYTYVALTDTEVIDNTAVSCQLNVTVVYDKDSAAYYLFDKTVGCTDLGGGYWSVNFTTQLVDSPVNFSETAVPHRHEVYNPEETPIKWLDMGYTNKYKCLDQSLSSQTIKFGDLSMSFIQNKVNEIYFLNVSASEISVVVTTTDTLTEIYNETIVMYDKNGGTFFNWVFSDFIYKKKLALEMPSAFEVKIDITIKALDGFARVGLVGIGRTNYIGATLYGAGIGMLDFSKKAVNTNGETYLEVGNYKATNNLTVDVPSGLTDQVVQLLTDYRSIPVVFKTDEFDSLVIFGVYNKFDILISTPTISKLSIDLESLI